MITIRFIVMDFSSHRAWAEGYQRWTEKYSDYCQVRLTIVSGEKWKFRMLSGAATSIDDLDPTNNNTEDDDIIVVDGMFDASIIKARSKHSKVLVYLHENQLTTPYSTQDRDQKNQTSWHFGMVHYRSLLASDGFIFNSHTHLREFQSALPRMLKEQCPTDEIEWHLEMCRQCFDAKCTFLHNGLNLDDLLAFTPVESGTTESNPKIPIILWNARLEEYKDPGSFLEILKLVRQETSIAFRLIALGTDPTKDQRWYQRFRDEISGHDQLLFMGWCSDRQEYAQHLRSADIVVSTSQHETFGISIVESVYCGALPLLPNRLSYPELFPPSTFGADHLYEHSLQDGVSKLVSLLQIVATNPDAVTVMQGKAKDAVTKFRWAHMGPMYNRLWSNVLGGESIGATTGRLQEKTTGTDEQTTPDERLIEITDASDPRVQLYRPKSLRDHALYHQQLEAMQIAPVLHGGRRAMVRMVEAIQLGANIRPLSFLTTRALAHSIESSAQIPIYTVDDIRLLNEIRGQSINSGDAILSMIQFPIAWPLETIQPPILVLSQVRNAENVGSLLRTAYCLGTIQSVLCGDATSWAAVRDSRAARCSMGTVFYHKFYRTDHLPETLLQLRQDHGICVYGIEINERAVPLHHHVNQDGKNDGKWAMVMGNEDAGLSHQVEAVCDTTLFIPQAHGDSLNVGHAAAIAMYELGKGTPLQPCHDGRGACP